MAHAQTATLFGKVTDKETPASPIEGVSVHVSGAPTGAGTDAKGAYSLTIPAGRDVLVEFSYIGMRTEVVTVRAKDGSRKQQNVRLEVAVNILDTAVVRAGRQSNEVNRQKIDLEALKSLPLPSSNVESAIGIFGLGARMTGGEMSAQYSVRGGNYDENLIYVNGFEIYRPLLVRSGQQEGLTFPNADLARSIAFSSGGFEAMYGDKMSSVLDIEYKVPTTFQGSIAGSILGASGHVEGSVRKKNDTTGIQRFRYLMGVRYKDTRYLLKALPQTGEYQPNFTDIQAAMSYDIGKRWKVDWIGNYNKGVYRLRPDSVKTTFGTLQNTLRLSIDYQGQEITDLTTAMTGLALTHARPDKGYFLKFLASAYQSEEQERFDVIGAYQLGVVSTQGSTAGQTVAVIGDGIDQRYGRNFLTSTVTNIEHRGGWEIRKGGRINPDSIFLNRKRSENSHYIKWGTRLQNEQITDRLKEWSRLDSAGYSLNWDTTQLNLKSVVKTQIGINSIRLNGYLQDTWTLVNPTAEWRINYGVRANYWNFTNEGFITPRAQISYKPLTTSKDITFRVAGGLYYQPAFYRELRDMQGNINNKLRSQKSAHIVAGLVYDFKWLNRPFRFITEAYYKQLWDQVPYEVDNVRLRYYATNSANGYATGLDMRLNGELVPGAESWINLSLLRTRESLDGVQHQALRENRITGAYEAYDSPDVPRPTDALASLNVYVQDYLPRNKNFKVHVNGSFMSGLPFGNPNNNIIFRNARRFDFYNRVDIGFSALAWDAKRHTNMQWLKHIRQIWASLEVYNLNNTPNTQSYSWVRTVLADQFAVNNRLTARLINARVRFEF